MKRNQIMGMTEQAAHLNALRERAQDKSVHYLDRIRAWGEWGRAQRDTFNMGTALREILDIIKSR
jgi:hypothetical protein